MKRARLLEHGGEMWVNLEDMRVAIREDEDLIEKVAAMIMVSRVQHRDSAVRSLRLALSCAVVEMTGVLEKDSN